MTTIIALLLAAFILWQISIIISQIKTKNYNTDLNDFYLLMQDFKFEVTTEQADKTSNISVIVHLVNELEGCSEYYDVAFMFDFSTRKFVGYKFIDY
jgi:hypothetical protein